VGTRQYQAPEVLEKRGYRGERVDIFSMGVILFTMVTGVMPYFDEASIEDPLYQLILRRKPEEYWSSWLAVKEQKKQVSDEGLTQESLDNITESNLLAELGEAMLNSLKKLIQPVVQLLTLLYQTIQTILDWNQNNEGSRSERDKNK